MNAEIITIGDELLIGQVIDTNSAWIAEQLNSVGVAVKQITSISDKQEHILQSLADAAGRADIILITGGLGPTRDDITKETLCEYFDTKLEFNEEAFQNVERIFKLRGFQVSDLNRKQAEIPASCEAIQNINGTAPGMWFEKDGKIYVSMPGVPFEMKPMVSDHIIPRLNDKINSSHIIHKTILTQGVGESFLAKMIEEWEDNLPENVKLAYLPQPGIVRLRITAVGDEIEHLKEQMKQLCTGLKLLIPDLIFGYDRETMEEVVGKLLLGSNKTISTAESCTGGNIAHLFTSIPGSSAYFMGSVVAYDNNVKTAILKVDPLTIEKHGAVSEEVVCSMAQGVKTLLNTDFAIATSGIAGPDGGTEEKPVGTTWIAVAIAEKVTAQKFLFGEHRGRNIRKASLAGLNMLRMELMGRG